MRRARFVLWSVLLALVLAASFGMALVRNGLSARSGLTSAEDRILYEVRKRVIAFNSGDRQNPQAGQWREAVHHFEEECAVCHGPAGRGDGMLGPLVFPPAPDLTSARTQSLSDAELHHVISEGIRFTAMPAMGDRDSEDEIWQLVSLVRQLPSLSAAQMKQATGEGSGGQGHSHEGKR
jgi:mono/diheme cytochrome c family protein